MTTKLQPYNYGLSGQPQSAYDEFLGLGRKAKKRREARKKVRQQRREARLDKARIKNDERRAEVEQTKVQTAITKQMANTAPETPTQSPAPANTGTTAAPQPQKAELGNSGLIIVAGVLLVAGFIYMNKKNKNAVVATNTAQAPKINV